VLVVKNVAIETFVLSTNVVVVVSCNVIVNVFANAVGTFIIRKVVPFGGADGNFKLKLTLFSINMFLGSEELSVITLFDSGETLNDP
jgi:hypothetical protein